MPATVTPLRYPGGKSQLYEYVKDIIDYNAMRRYTYVEPFAGGAGLALKLLYNGIVSRIVINDFDPAIYAVWHSCLNCPEELIDRIKTTPIDIKEWDRQRKIYYSTGEQSLLDLGFSTLFLNRTNVSGIISGGVIGGRRQAGTAKIDVRFNRETLSKKIEKIYSYRNQICLYNLDAGALIRELDKQRGVFYNIDPPYVEKGSQLYRNYFSNKDHVSLAALVSQCPHPWMVTYDVCPLVKTLYGEYRCSKLDVRYSANIKRSANEYVFFSNSLTLPQTVVLC